ncbi:DUF6221 family protein [Streptomyces sp. NPDC002537]
MTTDLLAFLRARLDEDEQTARETAWSLNTMRHNGWEARPGDGLGDDYEWEVWANSRFRMCGGLQGADARHIARHDPARVLADIAGRRAILDLYEEPEASGALPDSANRFTGSVQRHVIGEVLPHLALPYAGHPDYREEWLP